MDSGLSTSIIILLTVNLLCFEACGGFKPLLAPVRTFNHCLLREVCNTFKFILNVLEACNLCLGFFKVEATSVVRIEL